MNGVIQRKRMRTSSARIFWRQHLDACAASGLRQVDYCRQRGLPPKYMTLWKRKLAAFSTDTVSAPAAPVADKKPRCPADRTPPTLIPVVVAESSAAAPKRFPSQDKPRTPGPVAENTLRVTLPNGVALSFDLQSSDVLPALLRELAQLPC